MTRINCIPPSELVGKHLVAEYRELPRVFSLAIKAYEREGRDMPIPVNYTLGTGHVRFFYNKLTYLHIRFNQLVEEMIMRSYSPNSDIALSVNNSVIHFPQALCNDWEPTDIAMAINRSRIAERLAEM